MYIPDLNDYSPPSMEVAEKFLSENRRKGIVSEIEQIVSEEFDRLTEYADEHISGVAASRAGKFLTRVLNGDSDAAMSLFGDTMDGSRYRMSGSDASKPWAHLIHGTLFETDGIILRRKIVEAHAELLQNERIKDLESVVAGLSQQVRELTRDLYMCRDRLR